VPGGRLKKLRNPSGIPPGTVILSLCVIFSGISSRLSTEKVIKNTEVSLLASVSLGILPGMI